MESVTPSPDEKVGVFVSPTGHASNPGTRAAPLDCPRAAIALARTGGRSVFLAAGVYTVELSTSVSLYGGYSEDFSELDPEAHPTHIRAPGDRHSTTALTIESGEVVVHGLTLRGGATTHAAAVQICSAARATLVRNVLIGGGRGPTPNAFTYSHGVNVASGDRPRFTLLQNHIHGGSNQYSWAIDGLCEGCVVEGNVLVGGSAATPNSSTSAIRGNGAFTLRNNTIDAGSGATAIGVEWLGNGATLEGNTITTHGDRWNALRLRSGDDVSLSGNTLDGVSDDVFFAFAKKLSRRTWTFHHVENDDFWSYDTLTLERWGWLYFGSDSSTEPTGSGYGGPSQSFHDFLQRGPAVPSTPPEIVEEVKALLRAAGVQ
jgi:hypothetical protein